MKGDLSTRRRRSLTSIMIWACGCELCVEASASSPAVRTGKAVGYRSATEHPDTLWCAGRGGPLWRARLARGAIDAFVHSPVRYPLVTSPARSAGRVLPISPGADGCSAGYGDPIRQHQVVTRYGKDHEQTKWKTTPLHTRPTNVDKVSVQVLSSLPPGGTTREFDRPVYARVVGIASETLEGEPVKGW
jgi:hypothetical protein